MNAPDSNQISYDAWEANAATRRGVRRGSRLFIPRGETMLKAGDRLVFVAE